MGWLRKLTKAKRSTTSCSSINSRKSRRESSPLEPHSGRDGQVMPLTADGLQLMNPAIVRIEEIATVWDSLGVCKTKRTLSPSGWSQASSMP
jgi:hypothetical protein